MITSGIPCNLNTWLMNKWAYSAAVISLVQGKKCIILVRRSTKIATIVLPSDSGKSVTRLMVICCQARLGRGIDYKAPAFFSQLLITCVDTPDMTVRSGLHHSINRTTSTSVWPSPLSTGFPRAQLWEHHGSPTRFSVAFLLGPLVFVDRPPPWSVSLEGISQNSCAQLHLWQLT